MVSTRHSAGAAAEQRKSNNASTGCLADTSTSRILLDCWGLVQENDLTLHQTYYNPTVNILVSGHFHFQVVSDNFGGSLMTFMWVIGINSTSSIIFSLPKNQGGYGFGPLAIGYLYFTPIIAVLIGEVIGHWGNDVSSGFLLSESRLLFYVSKQTANSLLPIQ